MMKLSLEFPVIKSSFTFSYSDKIFLIGSCFTTNIGKALLEDKFDVTVNPTGILFDPLSISRHLQRIASKEKYSQKDIYYSNGLYLSPDHHSQFSGSSPDVVREKVNQAVHLAHEQLKEATILVITPGTAHSYLFKKSASFVANCHKMPSSEFEKHLIRISEMKDELSSSIKKIKTINPEIKIILTVSPVRHIRDGLEENTRSKARLIEVVQSIAEEIEGVIYYPSYEIVMDVLRDYRFFDRDLVHPTEQAIEIIYDHFYNSFTNEETKKLSGEIRKIKAGMAHQVFFPGTEAHDKFKISNRKLIQDLKIKLPNLSWDQEESYFN